MSPGNLWKGRADGPRMGYETTEAPAEGGSSLRNPLRSAEPQEVVGEKGRVMHGTGAGARLETFVSELFSYLISSSFLVSPAGTLGG